MDDATQNVFQTHPSSSVRPPVLPKPGAGLAARPVPHAGMNNQGIEPGNSGFREDAIAHQGISASNPRSGTMEP